MYMKFWKYENIKCGFMYAYVHFILEVICFCMLSRLSNSLIVWLIPFLYDAFAFVPQSLIGYLKDKFPKLNVGLIGMILLIISIVLFCFLNISKYVIVFIMAIGNACLHVEGAYNTLLSSNGKLSHSAIFVGFGAIGVITGRVIAKTIMPTWFLLPIIITILPILLIGMDYHKDIICNNYNYVKEDKNKFMVIILVTFVVLVRGYLGYRIPSAWKTTTIHTVILFVTMGLGKCLGGILSDLFGLKKIAAISTLLAIPFLLLGNNNIIVSLIGIMIFSLSMPITLAMIISVLKKNPGLAFGFTTIGLFFGTLPIFFINITNMVVNTIIVLILSIISFLIMNSLLKEDK